MYQLYKLRQMGLTVQGYEAAPDVGGTWYWNKYPGCRTDCEGYYYCFSFDPEMLQEWAWKERYPSQSEMLEYFHYAADKMDIRRDFKFNTRVPSAIWDDGIGRWLVQTETGETVRAQFLITAVGILSAPNVPPVPGVENFRGEWHHTARWPEDPVDFSGKTVGLIGTGSTGVQMLPILAGGADKVMVFQRTPNFVMPARNRELTAEEQERIKADYDTVWQKVRQHPFSFPFDASGVAGGQVDEEERTKVLQTAWDYGGFPILFAFEDLLVDQTANEAACKFIRDRIREVVADPAVADLLTPHGYPLGAKRPPSGSGYYESYNRDNVQLVDVSSNAICEITERGLRTADGTEYEFDVLVFATGFDASTGELTRMNIVGKNGSTLREKWRHGPKTYLGYGVHEFPNMFMISGPQSPFTNIAPMAQKSGDWIADAITFVRERGMDEIEPTKEAEEMYSELILSIAGQTLLTAGVGVHSWFAGSNVDGKAPVVNVFFGGANNYMDMTDEAAQNDYEGYEIRSHRSSRASDLASWAKVHDVRSGAHSIPI
jgi:cyclohexanone monooxygenase